MAKTNLFPSAQQRLLSLQRKRRSLHLALEDVETMLSLRREKTLENYGAKLDKTLMKAAFAACDKEEYAQRRMDAALQQFDVKQNMDRRAVNHGCAKAIFEAAAKGEDWKGLIEKQRSELAALEGKRAEEAARLEKEREAFLSKSSTAGMDVYETAKAAALEKYNKKKAALEKKDSAALEKKQARLRRSIAALDSKIDALHGSAKTIELPEDVLLRVEGLKMYFGGLKAVDDVTFDVKKGEIFGLIGPNGAGKTTVFNCITRFYDATGGDIHFCNKDDEVVDLRGFQVHDVILQGIARTFQNVELVKEISVLENLLVACTRDYRSNLLVQALGLPSLRREEEALKEKARRVLKFMGLESYANWLAFGLPYGILKKVEIARALMSDARLIIMDEPAAGLNDSETAELTETIRRIRDEFGVTILLVEHDMSLVMNVCDTVCAISFGKMLAIGTCQEIKQNKAVQEAYLGIEEV